MSQWTLEDLYRTQSAATFNDSLWGKKETLETTKAAGRLEDGRDDQEDHEESTNGHHNHHDDHEDDLSTYACWGSPANITMDDNDDASSILARPLAALRPKPTLNTGSNRKMTTRSAGYPGVRSVFSLIAQESRELAPPMSATKTEAVVAGYETEEDGSIAASFEGIYTSRKGAADTHVVEQRSFTDYAAPEEQELQQSMELNRLRKKVRNRSIIAMLVLLGLGLLLMTILLATKNKRDRRRSEIAAARGEISASGGVVAGDTPVEFDQDRAEDEKEEKEKEEHVVTSEAAQEEPVQNALPTTAAAVSTNPSKSKDKSKNKDKNPKSKDKSTKEQSNKSAKATGKSNGKSGKSSSSFCEKKPQSLDQEELECGFFGDLFMFSQEQEGILTSIQAFALHNTDFARYCPCLGTTTEVSVGGGITQDVTICGSYVESEGTNMDPYRQYCQETFDSVNEENLYESVVYDVAHQEYVRQIEELAENETLSYQEILLETNAALEELRQQLIVSSPEINFCLEGCALFIRDICCLEQAFRPFGGRAPGGDP